jgi:PAS domain S-box-containing protein
MAEDGRLFCVVSEVTARVLEERMRDWLAAIVDNASDAIVGVDVDGHIFSWNGGAERLYGYRADEMCGQHIARLAPNDAARAAILEVWQRAIAGVKHQEYDAPRARSSGEPVDVHVQVRAVEDAQGAVIGWSVTSRDISERKRLVEQLANQVELYGAIVRSLPRGSVTVFDRALRFVAAEGELLSLLGIGREAIVGRQLAEVASSPNRDAMEQVYRRALEGESTEYEAERGGRTLLIRVAPLRNSLGQTSGGLVLSFDVTEQRQEAEQLRRAKLLLDATLENITDGVALLDTERQILFANNAFANIFGLARDQLPGLSRGRFCALVAEHFDDPAHFRERLLASGPDMRSSDEFSMHSPQRRVLRGTLKRVGGVREAGYLAVWRDVTNDSDLLAERGREALTDVLTGITNRRGAEQALHASFALAKRAGTPLTVAMFDIDHFKRVNDVHGHRMGDAVIQAVAKVLSAAARSTDLVARWGGEEFIAILPVEHEGALAFCERARGRNRVAM